MRRSSLAFLLTLLVSSANSAEHVMRPGLWELSTTSNLLALVQQIPPDQMQQLKNLARRYGLEMPQIQNGAATSRVCITQDMADQKIPPHFQHTQSGCGRKDATRTGNSYTMNLVCDSAEIKGSGRAEGVFNSPESFSGRSEFQGTVRGAPINEHADTSGRWLGATCEAAKAAP